MRFAAIDSPAARALVATTLVDAVGGGLLIAGSVIFFVQEIGLSGAEVGLGAALASAVGAAGMVPLSRMADRVGARRALVAMHLWRAAWLCVLPFVSSFSGFCLVWICLVVADRAVAPISRALTSAVAGPAGRVALSAAMRSVRNAGFSIGAALTVGLLAAPGTWPKRAIFLGDALSFVLVAAMLMRMRLPPTAAAPRSATAPRRRRLATDRRFLGLAAIDGVLTLHLAVLTVGMPLWVVSHTGAPAALAPALVVLNTVMAVTLQVPFAARSEGLDGGIWALRIAGLSLTLACGLFALASGRSPVVASLLLAVAVATLTVGEMLQSGAAWSLGYRFAPPDHQAEFMAFIGIGLAVQQVVGPPLLASGVISAGAAGWLGLALAFAIAGAVARPLIEFLERARRADGS